VRVVSDPLALRAELDRERSSGRSVGFVPTMGYLHDGHVSLVTPARQNNDVVVVSIFVNPLQFGPNEDFEKYPRDDARDNAICESAGADIIFRPDVSTMYGNGEQFTVDVGRIGTVLEGASRPGHFNGVATVVAKLFNIIGPCRAYFGQKDAQQLAVIRRLVDSFNIPVDVIGRETIREEDGLAMSSRNVYLSDEERRRSVALFQGLMLVKEEFERGITDSPSLVHAAEMHIRKASIEIDYIRIADPETFQELPEAKSGAVIVGAVRVGATRLIDNVTI
jgi:pantoate--beta-alanine ligase